MPSHYTPIEFFPLFGSQTEKYKLREERMVFLQHEHLNINSTCRNREHVCNSVYVRGKWPTINQYKKDDINIGVRKDWR